MLCRDWKKLRSCSSRGLGRSCAIRMRAANFMLRRSRFPSRRRRAGISIPTVFRAQRRSHFGHSRMRPSLVLARAHGRIICRCPGLARVRCRERREGHCGTRIDGLSNADQEQAGTMGSDSEPVPGLRWNPGRAYLYSVDAGKEVAGSQSKVRSQMSRTEILHGWLSISKPIRPG